MIRFCGMLALPDSGTMEVPLISTPQRKMPEGSIQSYTLFPATTTKPQDAGSALTKEILDEVVKATKAPYREKGREDGIRATAHKY